MRLSTLAAALLLAACGTPAGTPDASEQADAATTFDAGDAPDAGPVPDAGDPVDAGNPPDAGDAADAGDPPPARCTTDACEAMIASCDVQFFNEPTNGADGTQLSRCGGTPPGNIQDIYSQRYCVPVCEAQGGAEYVNCMASGALRCLNGESGASGDVNEECSNLYPTPPKQQSCVNTCNTTRDTCDRACVTGNGTNWLDCMDCQLECGLARVSCRAACPDP